MIFLDIEVKDIEAYVKKLSDKCLLHELHVAEQAIDSDIFKESCMMDVTDLPIGSVAMSCGYRDPLVFSKAFKGKKGMSPSQYRKKSRDAQKEKSKRILNV